MIVKHLVLEGLRSQPFVERCEVSGETLQMALYFLLLQDRFGSFEAGRKKTSGVTFISNISHKGAVDASQRRL